jgi:hypothetical protein
MRRGHYDRLRDDREAAADESRGDVLENRPRSGEGRRVNKTAGGSAGAQMSPLPSDNADSTLHAAGSVSLAPVFTPHGRLTLSPAVEALLLRDLPTTRH